MKKNIKLLLFFITLFIAGYMVVGAETAQREHLISRYEGVQIYYKSIGGKTSHCISGANLFSPLDDVVCEVNNSLLTDEKRAIIGEIFVGDCGELGDDICFVEKEVAIEMYLGVSESGPADQAGTPSEALKTRAQKRIDDAKTASTYAKNLTFSAEKLTFTKKGDYYESQNISVLGVADYFTTPELSIVGMEDATIEGTYESFIVKVPAKKVEKNSDLTVKVSSTLTYNTATLYDCPEKVGYKTVGEKLVYDEGSPDKLDTQDVATHTTETRVVENTISGTIEVEEVVVPDTLSSNSTLLVAIAMLSIALGIWIITYVKKNKITE